MFLREQRDVECTAYVSLRHWRDLLRCATDLEAIGVRIMLETSRSAAVETASE